jgi:hypothetical protein
MGDFDFWAKEWPVITGAPHIVIVGAIVLAGIITIIVRWGYSREIVGLKQEKNIKDAQLNLARDEQTTMTKQIDTLKTYVSKLEAEVLALKPTASSYQFDAISSTSSRVATTVKSLSDANNALGHTLTASGALYGTGNLRAIAEVVTKKSE